MGMNEIRRRVWMKKISVSEEDVYKEIYIESEIAKL